MMDWDDVSLGVPIFLVIVSILVLQWRKIKDKTIRKYFLPAGIFKLSGAVFFSCIYQFYYKGGDTFDYFDSGGLIWYIAEERGLWDALRVMWISAGEYTDLYNFTSMTRFSQSKEEWLMTKISGFLGLLAWDTYIVISFYLAMFSFAGSWKMYKAFARMYPQFAREMAYAILFIPSVAFWGSGLLKDTVTLGAAGFLVGYAFDIMVFKQNRLWAMIIIILMLWLIASLKGYLIFVFVPGMAFWVYRKIQKNIANSFVRYLTIPLLLPLFGVIGIYAASRLTAGTEFGTVDSIMYKVSGFHGDHGSGIYGSAYKLPAFEFTIPSLLSIMPYCINLTLFRPYLWEVKNVVMILSASESLLCLIVSVLIVFRAGPIRTIRLILENDELIMCIWIVLSLGFAASFTSLNFGLLSRAKIPLMPFFGIALIILYSSATAIYRARRERRRQLLKQKGIKTG